jgi:hypothetical protein
VVGHYCHDSTLPGHGYCTPAPPHQILRNFPTDSHRTCYSRLGCCWYHLVPHFGYIYGYQVWLYISFAFWSADRLARVTRVAYYNRLGNSKAIVEASPGCDIMQVTAFPRVSWAFGPGQHSFVYLPELGKFWESHPFSIAGWNRPGATPARFASASLSYGTGREDGGKSDVVLLAKDLDSQPNLGARKQEVTISQHTQGQDGPSIQFLIRVHSGMTSALAHRLLSSPSRSSMEISMYTEGPYAGHRATLQPLLLADTVLCLIGGIGITNALGFVKEYTSANLRRDESSGKNAGVMKATRFILAWSARELALIEHVKRYFLVEEEDVKGIEYLFWCTSLANTAAERIGPINDGSQKQESLTQGTAVTATSGRMDIGAVIRSSVEPGHQTTVLVCDPGSMADEATRQVVNCVKNGFRVDLVEETFAW